MPFVHSVVVGPADIDGLGHAGNLVYLRWTLEAALAHSTALGLDEAAYLARGQAWIVRRHVIDYLRPAVAGDALQVQTRVTGMNAASSVRATLIVRAAGGAPLCRAMTDWVYVAMPSGRPTRIPEDVRSRFPLEP